MSGSITYRYLTVVIAFAPSSTIKTKELEPLMASISGDWLRYAGNAWVLWTAYTAHECTQRIRQQLAPLDHVLVVGLDMHDKDGWQPRWVWDWLNKERPVTNPIMPPPYWTPPPPPLPRNELAEFIRQIGAPKKP